MRYILLFTSLTALFCGHSQNRPSPEVLDSLRAVWSDPQRDAKERLSALYDYGWDGYIHYSPDSALYWGRFQAALATNLGETEYIAKAYNLIGTAQKILGNYSEAEKAIHVSIKIYKKTNERVNLRKSYNNLGNIAYLQSKMTDAIEYFTISLNMAREDKDTASIATCLNNMSAIYYMTEDLASAEKYYYESLELAKIAGDSLMIANVYNNLGLIRKQQNSREEALDFLVNALEIRKRHNDARAVAASYLNLGNLFKSYNNREQALEYYQKCLEMERSLGNAEGIASSLENIGLMYLEESKIDLTIKYSKEAYDIALKSGLVKVISSSAKTLYKAYKSQGKISEALRMHETHLIMRDSLEKIENTRALLARELNEEYTRKRLADSINAAKKDELQAAQVAAKEREHELEVAEEKQQKIYLYAGLGFLILLAGGIYTRFQNAKKQKELIAQQKEEVDLAYGQLEEKTKEIMDSIQYAKRIQSAILPPDETVKSIIPKSFIFYAPKDIVAGDFYYLESGVGQHGKTIKYIAVCDCTGHGVPGAMVSVVCNNGLNRAIREHGLTDPGEILNKTKEIVVAEFAKSTDEVRDGMDAALITIEDRQLNYAGANNPLWIIRKSQTSSISSERIKVSLEEGLELLEFVPNKAPIGKYTSNTPFESIQIELQKGDRVFLFTDGYADQFGGPKAKKLKSSNFKKLILSLQHLSIEEQGQELAGYLNGWKGDLEQLDDICVMGIEV